MQSSEEFVNANLMDLNSDQKIEENSSKASSNIQLLQSNNSESKFSVNEMASSEINKSRILSSIFSGSLFRKIYQQKFICFSKIS